MDQNNESSCPQITLKEMLISLKNHRAFIDAQINCIERTLNYIYTTEDRFADLMRESKDLKQTRLSYLELLSTMPHFEKK